MTLEEFEEQKQNKFYRFYVDRNKEDECYEIIDRETGEVIGQDGGEPEDQLLVRNWSWVVKALNNLHYENKKK